MEERRVSIVIPVYNAESTLEECLNSVCGQTLKDFEVIAVHDGSTDRSLEIVRNFSRIDSRIRLIDSGKIGLVQALNRGLQESRSKWIARMDADDLMHTTRLEVQVEYLRNHPEIALVCCQVALFPQENVRSGYRAYERWQNACITPSDIADNLYVESPMAHPSVLFRREIVLGLGGYREGQFPEDYELWLRMAEAGHLMAKVPQVLLHWRERPDRLSRIDSRYSRDAFDRLRAEYLARDPRVGGARELVLWGAGRATRKRARHLLQHGIRHSAWIDIDPRKIGKIIRNKTVHPPEWLDRAQRPFVLVYVTNHGAREEIAARLEGMGYRRGTNFLAVG